MQKYIPLEKLEVYTISRTMSSIAWEIYQSLNWQDRKIMGDQFIESTDSVGANIAEGYRRYHFLDKIKFYYNSRASLSESCSHWLELLYERKKVNTDTFKLLKETSNQLSLKLTNFINATYRSRNDKSHEQNS